MHAPKAALWAGLLLLADPTFAASTKINGVTYDSTKIETKGALVTADSSLRLKKVFLFPTVDDMSGVLAPKLDEKILQIFSRNSRFEVIRDPQVLKALTPDDASYSKAAMSQQVHKEAGRVTGADTTVLLRTRNVGNETEMTLEFRDAEGNLLFSETGSLPGFSAMEARWGLIDKLFQGILAKIPFDGTVTGRTAKTLTLDLGGAYIRTGEEVDLVKIVSVQKHPLLGTIVGTDYVRVGKAKVTSVDRSLSFAEVMEEYPGEMISTGQKVLKTRATLIRRPEPQEYPQDIRRPKQIEQSQNEPAGKDFFEDRVKGDFDQPKARYGQVGVNLQYGSLTHSQTVNGTAQEFSGSGIGGNIQGELWITREWIFSALYGFHSASLKGTNSVLGDSSWSKAEAYGGYKIIPDEILEGASFSGNVGYQSQSFTVPTPSGSTISGKKYSGIAVKLEGEMSFIQNHKLSFGFGFQPFSSLTDAGVSTSTPDGATVIGFHVDWNYRIGSTLWGRLGIQYDTASGSYTDGSTVNDKRFAIGPGLFYSF